MKRTIMTIAIVLALSGLSAMAVSAAVPTLEECFKSCAGEMTACEKEGREQCQALADQCRMRCDNVAAYVHCSSVCGEGDPACFEKCRNDFRVRVPEYRMWLERNGI